MSQKLEGSMLQKQYEELVANIDGIVWEADSRTIQFTFVSYQAERLLGYPLAEWLKPGFWMNHLHPEDRDWALELYIRASREKHSDNIEYRMIAADGRIVWLRDIVSVVEEENELIKLCGIKVDITEHKQGERERLAHLRFFESMDRINRAIQGAHDLEQMMSDVLDTVLAIFDCDRAWLLYPCDPEASSWYIPMERTRPEYPGAFAQGLHYPCDPQVIQSFQAVRAVSGPVKFGPGSEHPIPAELVERFNIKSMMAMALYPKVDKPYMFGLHQRSYSRIWTPDEERLFQEVGRRLEDALTSLLTYLAFRESEGRLAEAQRIAHVGYWDQDLVACRVILSDETCRIFGLLPGECNLDLAQWHQQWLELIHPDDREKTFQAAVHALQGGSRYDVEYRVIQPSGDVRFIRSEAVVTSDHLGQPCRWFGVIQDITELRQAECDLHASEVRFRTFVDHAIDAFFLHNDEGTILDVNNQACESLGYTREELIGLTPEEFDVDVGTAMIPKQIWSRLRSGEVVTFDTHHRRKDGTVFPVEVRIRPFWENGRLFSISLTRDITNQKRTQEALILFRSLIDQTDDVIEILDPETGRFLDINEKACLAHGYTREEYLTLTVPDINPMMSFPIFKEASDELRRIGSRVFESQHRRKDGSIFPVEINIHYIHLDRGYLLAIVRDITERERAKQDLIESHCLLNAVIEGIPDVVFVKDFQGRYLMVNSAGTRFLNKTLEEVIGKEEWELFSPDTAWTVKEFDRQVIESGETLTFEETVTASGLTRTYLVTKCAYRDIQGKVVGLIGISRDITEVKRLEEQFSQAQKMEAVGRLAGGVAHDFNNLLTVINSYSELVFSNLQSDDPNREMIAQIQKSGERAANLTRQLLAFSRKQVLQPQIVQLNTLLSELLKLLRRLLGEDIELILAPSTSLDLAKVDPGQFEQAIINLAVNARDAMPLGGRLTIETHNCDLDMNFAERHVEVKPGQYVLVVVSDTGQGMDETTKARIFEPFFTTKGPGHGTGLGLAMVYGFVKQTGGHIEVDSELDHGTTFKIYLPCIEETSPFTETSQDIFKVPKGTETLLLVEDEDSLRSLLKLILQTSGYTVLEARDGQEALELAQQYPNRIHIIVTDVVMPRMSGRQLADLITLTWPDIRILFMSGYTDEAMLRHNILQANVAFIQKPFNPIALVRKVREVLDANDSSR